jgi:hypothetical protein
VKYDPDARRVRIRATLLGETFASLPTYLVQPTAVSVQKVTNDAESEQPAPF